MAQGQNLLRRFAFNGITMEDPSPGASVDSVRMLFARMHPDLLNAQVEGPEIQGGVALYKFARAVGTKGLA